MLALGIMLALQYHASAASIDYITNTTSIFSGSYDNDYDYLTGLHQHITPADGNATVSASSVPSTNLPGQLFASQAISGSIFSPNSGVTSTAFASAYVNVAAGTMGVSAGGSQFVIGGADARLADRVTFLNNSGQAANIDIFWTVDGTVQTGVFGRTDLRSEFCIGPGPAGPGACSAEVLYTFSAGVETSQYISGWVSSFLTPGNSEGFEQFHGIITIPAGLSSDGIFGNLNLVCGAGFGGSSCDFANTGSLGFTLPPGVSFTSASGVLLTQAAAPEPATLGLLGLGLCAFLVQLCVRRKCR